MSRIYCIKLVIKLTSYDKENFSYIDTTNLKNLLNYNTNFYKKLHIDFYVTFNMTCCFEQILIIFHRISCNPYSPKTY